MGGAVARETLATFATAVVLVSAVVFLVMTTPAAGKTHAPLPTRIGEAVSIEIGTAISIEKELTASTAPDGSTRYDLTVSNTSPVESVVLRELTDIEHGDLNGRGDCSVPQVIPAGTAYRCSFGS